MNYMTQRPNELPTRRRCLIADDATYGRFRGKAVAAGLTNNMTLAALLDCFDARSEPIRVEGAGLRVLCGQNAPCAPDCPSAGSAPALHAKPTRRSVDDLSPDELLRLIAAAEAEAGREREREAGLRKTLREILNALGQDG